MTIGSLQQRLHHILPGARLEQVVLDTQDPLRLWLLNADYPQGELSAEQVRQVMDNPLYWVFCWASGQVLARWLLEHPEWVRGRRVLDFGCGSGVVAIAAALAGAREVVACDVDRDALDATAANAKLNGIELQLAADFDQVSGTVDLLIAADVLYDRANLAWLERFRQRAQQVLVADSRIKDFSAPGYRQLATRKSCTLPDLDESAAFREVRIYLGSGTSLPSAR